MRATLHAARVYGRGERTVILAHGLGSDQTVWRHQVEHLATTARVVTFDLAGSGSAAPELWSPTRHASLYGFVDDLAALCAEMGLRGATYVGHSLSGLVGALAVAADPGLFSRLVLIGSSARYLDDPATGYAGGFAEAQVRALLSAMEQDFVAWVSGFAPAAMANADRPEFTREFTRTLAAYRPDVALAAFRTAFTCDHREEVRRVRTPTLVLQTMADVAVPLPAAKWLAEAMGASLAMIPADGHFPHLIAPGAVNAALSHFLGHAPIRSVA